MGLCGTRDKGAVVGHSAGCVACGGVRLGKLYELGQGTSILICGECGLWMTDPMPSGSELVDMYSRYHEKWGVVGREEEMHRKMRRGTFEMLFDWMIDNGCPPRGGRLMDVGCSTGICMETARARGWDVYGIDISLSAVNSAKRIFGDRVRLADLEGGAVFEDEAYDVVIMTDVLEHMRDPVRAMRKVGSLVKSGSVLVVVTVDTGTLSARLMGKSWIQIRKEHLVYFSKSNLKSLLEGAGFDLVKTGSPHKTTNLHYIRDYIEQTRRDIPSLGALCEIAGWSIDALPKRLIYANFKIPTGDIAVLARKR